MTTHATPEPNDPTDLPAVVRAFFAAHSAREAEAALRTFTDDAVVVDQDETFRGTEQVRGFLQDSGSEFTYTTEVLEARCEDDTRWTVAVRLEGDFPGHVAQLGYRFTVSGGRISGLTIG
ncbi:nuclear transport factor 2 family protein [Phycicoccus sp. HDW14]|uniref:nuclear transport factor 2 family protein n=1 Tax=Phycicoccus sp. HDW14 TaxID=2714941 RepID=UPI001409C949|nr:nuclear transport factor 2 family protein [Phycicoccus sp. HDW14]QIM22823.1 nuclear transport factor 2 family protein [Phycicoccus sp. HDW14]